MYNENGVLVALMMPKAKTFADVAEKGQKLKRGVNMQGYVGKIMLSRV